MNGLTDKQQAILSITSASLIAIGATSIPAGAPWWIGFVLSLAGAIGFGIKESLGGRAKPA